MNVVLTTLNAKFSHSNLALRYLQAYCQRGGLDIKVEEFNINQSLDFITGELVKLSPTVLGFSCYIWNIEETLKIVQDLKQVLPHTIIVLGGPEVSFEYEELMENYREVDYIISGEGEQALLDLLNLIRQQQNPPRADLMRVGGLVFRVQGKLLANPRKYLDLNALPSVYPEDNLEELANKIVYYETSRGCPFRCAYCLSSRTGNVRYFSLERSKQELQRLARLGVGQIRFVDRTFNCDKHRALELIKFMASLDTPTRFQLEISGDLLTPEMLSEFSKAPAGRFQFEIGVQSTNPDTLHTVARVTDLEELAQKVRWVKENTKVTVLLDLIAGLPYESFARFGESFDFVYSLRPDKIQLGFLKLLKGSKLRMDASTYGITYSPRAPYQVLYTDHLSFRELLRLHTIEDLVERYYNSGRFAHSLDYLLSNYSSPFALFNTLAARWEQKGYHSISHSVYTLYKLIYELMGPDKTLLDCLKLDFRLNEAKRTTPNWLGGSQRRTIENHLIRSNILERWLPRDFHHLSSRELGKKIHAEQFASLVYPSLEISSRPQTLLFFYPQPNESPLVFDITKEVEQM